MPSHLEQAQELRRQYKEAFLPVPPHPDHAPPAQAAPPQAGGAPPAGASAPPPPGAPPGAPPAGDPMAGGMPGAPPPSDPGPPPVNPDIIAVLQDTVGKLEEFGKMQQATQQELAEVKAEIAHERDMKKQRTDLINTFTQ